MLTKKELLKNYEDLKNYWLSEGVKEIFEPGEVDFLKKYHIDIDQALIPESKRYWAIRHIGDIINNFKDYEERINKFVSRLQDKWWKLWNKSFQRIEKEACHWNREGFESKEDYIDYLHDEVDNIYGWNSNNAYEAEVINNQLKDISKITGEYYEVYYG